MKAAELSPHPLHLSWSGRQILPEITAKRRLKFVEEFPVNSSSHLEEKTPVRTKGYELVDFQDIPGVECPCGTARRAFGDDPNYPGTIHVTEIRENAQLHYHKRLTETYYFLECESDARLQLNDEIVPVRPGLCVMIRPGTRHRAIGKMKVLIVVFPKFDPADEWFD